MVRGFERRASAPRLEPERAEYRPKYKQVKMHFENWEQLVRFHRQFTDNVTLESTILQLIATAQQLRIEILQDVIQKTETRDRRLVNSSKEVIFAADQKLKEINLTRSASARSTTATNQVEASTQQTTDAHTSKNETTPTPSIAPAKMRTKTTGGQRF